MSKVFKLGGESLNRNDRSKVIFKKAKSEPSNIERAMSNRAKNQQRQGVRATASLDREESSMFTTATGDADTLADPMSRNWPDKFELGRGLHDSKPRKEKNAEERIETRPNSPWAAFC